MLSLLSGVGVAAGESSLDPQAELDKILKSASDAPAFRQGLLGSCQPSTPDDQATDYDQDHECQRCTESGVGWSATFRFLPDPDRGECTLQQVELSVSDVRLEESFRRHLSDAWGEPPHATEFVNADQLWLVNPLGTPSGWQLPAGRAWLYKVIEPPYALRFLWRKSRLVELLEASISDEGHRNVSLEACRQAGGDDCDAADTQNGKDENSRANAEAPFRRSLLRLAGTKQDDPSIPAQLYRTQLLGELIASLAEYPEDPVSTAGILNKKFPELEAVKASFTTGGWKGESIVFASSFRTRLLDEYQNVQWGRQAFLDSLDEYDGYSDGCDASGFAPVADAIRKAEDFLTRYPETETSDDVRLRLAQAYETWWSISISGSETGDQFDDDVPVALAGREQAKQKALAFYRRLAARPGDHVWLKDKIFRLEHNLDTGERSWHCSQC
jgi:hypothetical protein